MKTTFLTLLVLILGFASGLNGQDRIIEINETSIDSPEVYDFGEVTDPVYIKYILKNNRNNVVEVKEVQTPAGFFANLSKMKIQPGKKVLVYIGLNPAFIKQKGNFEKQIILKTNLITNIVIPVKGTITEQ